jgi:hypothetical protein
MKSFEKYPIVRGLPVIALWVGMAAYAAPAVSAGEEASLARGAQEDSTPRQRYNTAIREAGGGLKINLEACKATGRSERASCNAQAQARYKEDMAAAKELLNNPQARPLNVTGGPIRSTVTDIEPKR